MPAAQSPQLGRHALNAEGLRFEAQIWTGTIPGIIPFRYRSKRSRSWQAGNAQDTITAQVEVLRHLGEANLLEAREMVNWAPVPTS